MFKWWKQNMAEVGARARYVLLEGALGGLGMSLGHLLGSEGQLEVGPSPAVFVDGNQTVSAGLAQGLDALFAEGDEPARWADVQYVVVSRGPGSYTGVRALLAFSHGLHGARWWQERHPKRHWIGVSSLAMIMISSCHGGAAAVGEAGWRGVFMVQGHRKGYFGWCEPVPGATEHSSSSSQWLSQYHQEYVADDEIDQLEFGGWRYYTVSAAVVSDADELAAIAGKSPAIQAFQELWWIPQQAAPGKSAAQGSAQACPSTCLVIRTTRMPQVVVIPLQAVSVHSLATAAAVRSSLGGMQQLLAGLVVGRGDDQASPSGGDGAVSSAPPAAAYLRPHYAGGRG